MSTDFSEDLEPYSVAVVEMEPNDRKLNILIRFEVSDANTSASLVTSQTKQTMWTRRRLMNGPPLINLRR